MSIQRFGIDLIGEIRLTSSKGHKYILVGIDYFTKWIEVIPLVNVEQEEIIELIQRHIVYRFRILERYMNSSLKWELSCRNSPLKWELSR